MSDLETSLICNYDDESSYYCPVHLGKHYINRVYGKKFAVEETVPLDEMIYGRLVSHRAGMTKTEKDMFSILVSVHVDFYFDLHIAPYFPDFFLWNFGVVFEVDGRSHIGREEKDDHKGKILEKLGIEIYRCESPNLNRIWVIERISETYKARGGYEKKYWKDIIDNHNKMYYSDTSPPKKI